MWKLEKHRVVVRRWEPQEKAKIWKIESCKEDLQANPRTWGPTCQHVVALIGNILEEVMSMSFADWVSCTKKDWMHRMGAHIHQENLPWNKMLHHAKQHCETNNTKCRTHRNGKPRKKAPRPAKRRESGEARVRPSHIGRAVLKENPLQHFTRNTGTHSSRATKANVCPLPREASLNTGLPIPFLRS